LISSILAHAIKSSFIYTKLLKLEREDVFHLATAKTTIEAKNLVESGFEHVCTTLQTLCSSEKESKPAAIYAVYLINDSKRLYVAITISMYLRV
jgi:hypothetical protein